MSDRHPGDRDITRLLIDLRDGDGEAVELLLNRVYEQLRAIAQNRMNAERPGHTLQATALVHETFLRLLGCHPVPWSSRKHFFAAAAEAMRRILIEHARRRARLKRGGTGRAVPLNVLDLATESDPAEILALDEAMQRLGEHDDRMYQIVRLRFFAGLSVAETASILNLSVRTTKREWACARTWLYQALHGRPS